MHQCTHTPVCSYVNSVDSTGEPLVPPSALPAAGSKAVYVTYCRAFSLPTLITLLRGYFAQHSTKLTETFVWLDFLALSPSAQAQSVLPDVVAAVHACKGMLVIVDEHGDLFTRAWCLFELFTAATRNPGDRWLQIIANSYTGSEAALVDAVFGANLATAVCGNAGDEAVLQEAAKRVRGPAGRVHVGTVVADAVWAAMAQHLPRLPPTGRPDIATVKVCLSSLACLLLPRLLGPRHVGDACCAHVCRHSGCRQSR